MNLGFIGTGKIASSVITGICTSKISFNKIIISPRNRSIAKNLKQKFRKVIIANNYFWLHGRKPFKENEDLSRELLRIRGSFFIN